MGSTYYPAKLRQGGSSMPPKPDTSLKVGTTTGTPLFPKFNDFIGTELVELYVGDPNPKLFRVHKDLLCRRIPYFKLMFDSQTGFKEALENKATFPEDKEESFDVLLEWVHMDNVREWGGKSDIFALYALGDKLCLPDFQDTVIDRIRTYHRENKKLQTFKGIGAEYNAAPPGSGLRLYLLRSILYSLKLKEMIEGGDSKGDFGFKVDDLEEALLESEDLRKDFLRGVRGYVISRLDLKNPSQGDDCEYHCHDREGPCSREKRSFLTS